MIYFANYPAGVSRSCISCYLFNVKTSEKQWSERIEQQRASGKSVSQWCREQDICYQTFLNWRKRLSQVQVMKSSPFVEIFEESSESTWMEITTRGVDFRHLSGSKKGFRSKNANRYYKYSETYC
jgi:hypothetical protein